MLRSPWEQQGKAKHSEDCGIQGQERTGGPSSLSFQESLALD
jgi:hypothetical protein